MNFTDYSGLIKFKTGPRGANVTNIRPEISRTYDIIDEVVRKHSQHQEGVVTSGNDSTHKVNSLHYKDLAIDIRGNNVSDEVMQKIADELQNRLGDDYDVEAEYFPEDLASDHIHIEYDPPVPPPPDPPPVRPSGPRIIICTPIN